MQEYQINRTHKKVLKENMVSQLKEIFKEDPEQIGDKYRISYGTIESLDVWLGEGNKTLCLETASKKGIEDDEIILETNRRFRRYLDAVTGYDTKQRRKKAVDASKKAEEI